MAIVFSGIQSTGSIHLGNYLGAIKHWLELQHNHQCWFGVMNLHAITVAQNRDQLAYNTYLAVAVYLASGLDLNKATIFVQSAVSQHAELAWILGTITPIGWLNRMTQFKDKSKNLKEENINLGLYSYPVLMAADILLYQANLVPVGNDQKQHLELARDIASAFNRHCQKIHQKDYFNLPEPLIIEQTKRIMSLQDASKKMSKSDPSPLSRIELSDEPSQIVNKIKKAKTDSAGIIVYNNDHPEIYNLINIFASLTNQQPQNIASQYQTYSKFKTDLADVIIAYLEPIQQKIKLLMADQTYLQQIITAGNQKARQQAQTTLNQIFNLLGL